MQTTEQNEYVYGVYALSGDEEMHELIFRTTDKSEAREVADSMHAIYNPLVVKFQLSEIVPTYMEID